jgi:hypothetical protein
MKGRVAAETAENRTEGVPPALEQLWTVCPTRYVL